MGNYRKQAEANYDGVARFLHWLVVVMIVMMFVIGWTMPHVHRNTLPVGLIAWHIGIGAALIAAMLVRIIWRFTHRPPPVTLSPLLSTISLIAHFFLYVGLIVEPVLGWANASARGWVVKLFGVMTYPSLASAGSAFGLELGGVHRLLAWALLSLIGMHVAAALFHRFVIKDCVLQRMMP